MIKNDKELFYNNVFYSGIVAKINWTIDLVWAATKSAKTKDLCNDAKSFLLAHNFTRCSLAVCNLMDERGMKAYYSFLFSAKQLLEVLQAAKDKGQIVDYNTQPTDRWKPHKFKFEQQVLVFDKSGMRQSGEIVGMLYNNDGWEYHVKIKVWNEVMECFVEEILLVFEKQVQSIDP